MSVKGSIFVLDMMKILIPALLILALAVAGLGIRVLLVKGGRFSKRCSSAEAAGEKNTRCACNDPANEDHENCRYYKEHHPDQAG